MSSGDDLGMQMWYGVPGIPFNHADSSEVMLNTGVAAPLLSDQPRGIIGHPISQQAANLGHIQHQQLSYQNDFTLQQQNHMLYEPQTNDYLATDYLYETYEDDSNNLASNHVIFSQASHIGEDESVSGLNSKPKKPKVHHNPALKLKTPIAYQKDTDLTAIPIMKEGMAVCEKCGAIGVKHAFYGKERKFCSLACARPPAGANMGPKSSFDIAKIISNVTAEYHKEISYSGDASKDFKSLSLNENFPTNNSSSTTANQSTNLNHFLSEATDQLVISTNPTNYLANQTNLVTSSNLCMEEDRSFASIIGDDVLTNDRNFLDIENSVSCSTLTNKTNEDSYMWESSYLEANNFRAADVSCFSHAPMSEFWHQMSAGMKVEVSCGEEAQMNDSFWIATVIKICGYKAKLRYEGFIDNASKDFWVDLCSEEVHPVGWCARQGNALIPPKSIQNKYEDWKEFLMKRLTGARTLPTNFHLQIIESIKSRFTTGLTLEVVDKHRIAQMRVATVTRIVGKRIHLRYHGAPSDDNGFWCEEDSPMLHPVGWSREVGHEIVAEQSYHEKCAEGNFDETDATKYLFKRPIKSDRGHFAEGMKLEVIDPLSLSDICVATVMKILRDGYLMLRLDSFNCDTSWSDWFCYHASSPNIFPAGFCEMNGISLSAPKGYEGQFSWQTYLSETHSIPASQQLFHREMIEHGFESGMSIEAVDLIDPRLICVATVKSVKGRLLRIHFDGWDSDFDQWVDCTSTDIYPVGWCSLVNFKLNGPRSVFSNASNGYLSRKKLGFRGKRGRPFRGRRGVPVYGQKWPDFSNLTPSVNSAPHDSISALYNKRRGRGRGRFLTSSSMAKIQKPENKTCKNEISPEFPSSGLVRGKRGRPRRTYLPASSVNAPRFPQQKRNSLTSCGASEDDISDETSSGIASLADSEIYDDCEKENNHSNKINDNNIKKSIQNSLENAQNSSAIIQNSRGNIANSDRNIASLGGNAASSGGNNQNSRGICTISSNANSPNFSRPFEKNEIDSFLRSTSSKDQNSDFQVSSSIDVAFESDSVSSVPSPVAFGTHSVQFFPEDNRRSALVTPTFDNCTQNVANGQFVNISSTSKQKFSEHPGACPQPSRDVQSPRNIPSVSNRSPQLFQDTTPSGDFPVSSSLNYTPRIIDNTLPLSKTNKIEPKLWTCSNVSSFLQANDCGPYCDKFLEKKIDGSKLLKLTQNEIMELTGMKVGPTLKLNNLVQQLLALVNPAQARYQATLLKRGILKS